MADASPIRVRHEGAVTRVDFTESRISDEVVIHRVGQELLKIADGDPAPCMMLCFGGVQFLSSAALGVLINVHNRLRARGGKLALCEIAAPILEAFKITRLDRLLQIHGTADAALKSLA